MPSLSVIYVAEHIERREISLKDKNKDNTLHQ